MKRSRILRIFAAGLAFLAGLLPSSASACAACFGRSDDPMAKGMNAGVFALLLVITSVLLAVGVFFAFLIRRAARMSAPEGAGASSEPAAAAIPAIPEPVSQSTH